MKQVLDEAKGQQGHQKIAQMPALLPDTSISRARSCKILESKQLADNNLEWVLLGKLVKYTVRNR